MSNVELYTRPGCSYCTAAKSFLLSRDILFTEYNTARSEQKLKEMLASAPTRTFPQVVIDNEWIGGFQELVKTDLSTVQQL